MLRTLFWKPYSRLLIVSDKAGWVLDEEAKELKRCTEALGIPTHIMKRVYFNIPQIVHYTSQFSLLLDIYKDRNRISVDYYHGKPEQGESFKKCFEALKAHHEAIGRVRVSTREMETLIRSTGIAAEKVVRIPIGIDTELFPPQTEERKHEMRERLGIPSDAVVIGSFQKDGTGWGEGMEPKLIKGPDVFLQVIGKVKAEIGNIHVLLSGPARGYVKQGLEKLGVPYTHRYMEDYREVAELYDALDLYLITSREEGGPKAVLESMSKGVPLVTTAVGQAKDLVKHGQNAMMAPIDAVSELADLSLKVLGNKELGSSLATQGFLTAKENSYHSQLPLWKTYFEKLIAS